MGRLEIPGSDLEDYIRRGQLPVFVPNYYRGAYYKAFWADPPACSVGEPRKTYLGERYFPLILQNVHRYFMLSAVIFLVSYRYFRTSRLHPG